MAIKYTVLTGADQNQVHTALTRSCERDRTTRGAYIHQIYGAKLIASEITPKDVNEYLSKRKLDFSPKTKLTLTSEDIKRPGQKDLETCAEETMIQISQRLLGYGNILFKEKLNGN
jgi:hypothetical protein